MDARHKVPLEEFIVERVPPHLQSEAHGEKLVGTRACARLHAAPCAKVEGAWLGRQAQWAASEGQLRGTQRAITQMTTEPVRKRYLSLLA